MAVYVVRTFQLDTAVEFFFRFGLEFKAEQHGPDGPIHYSAVNAAGDVFELYPAQKQSRANFYDDHSERREP